MIGYFYYFYYLALSNCIYKSYLNNFIRGGILMFKNFFKTLFGKKSSDEDTRKIEDSCNYWADKDAVDYSPSFTAQDVLSSTETVNASDTTLSKETEEDKKNTSGGSWGCGGGCGGGCIGGCGGGCL